MNSLFDNLLFNKLDDYFKHNIKISLIYGTILIIFTKEDLFYCIDIENILNNDNSVIEKMIIKDLCYKQINDLNICYLGSNCCLARNEYKIYYDIKYGAMKEYISDQKIDVLW
jgi:hypothetical protein